MIHIASQNEFDLFEREASPPWRNFKLVKAGEGRKNNWWLAWNGERMANSRDLKILAEHYPETARWIVSVLGTTHHRVTVTDGNARSPL